METENIRNRISELIAELSSCREDERNTQSQILQVISVAGTILGILLTASYINLGKNERIIVFSNVGKDDTNYLSKFCNIICENVTYARIMFWFSLLIFCAAITYVIVLGTSNILRYYYIQSLEDRLHNLITNTPDDDNRGTFLHWSAYNAPVITRNFNHITSTHTALIHVCYSAATCCVILFCMLMVTLLFMEITPKKKFDYMIISIIIILMLLTAYFFLRTATKAKEVAQFAWDTAHENQKRRLEGNSQNLYEKNKSFKYTLLYLIYPKKQDPQKPLLIILGFICGIILMNIAISPIYIWRLIFVLITFDFLAYQARYQINDIRGLKEDEEAGAKNRLLINGINNAKHIIKISFIVAFMKIITCVTMTIFLGGMIKKILLINLFFLFVSTILYEAARTKKITWLVFTLVGIGYPLRFFVGFFSATLLKMSVHSVQMICFMVALWLYGSFASILAWTNEVIERMRKAKKNNNGFPNSYEKKHFEDIQIIITDRYILGEEHSVNGRIMPLRERCKLRDPWNLTMVLCMAFLFLTVCVGKIPPFLLVMESAVCVAFIINIYLRYKKKVILMSIGWICIIGKVVVSIIFYKISNWYLLFSIIQMIITITYFILSYQPQIKKISYKEIFNKLKRGVMIKILGEYAFDIMSGEKNSRI